MANEAWAPKFDFSRYIGLSSSDGGEVIENVEATDPTAGRSGGLRKLPRRINTLKRTQTRSSLLNKIDLDRLMLETRVGLGSSQSSGALGQSGCSMKAVPTQPGESEAVSPGPWTAESHGVRNIGTGVPTPRSPPTKHRQHSPRATRLTPRNLSAFHFPDKSATENDPSAFIENKTTSENGPVSTANNTSMNDQDGGQSCEIRLEVEEYLQNECDAKADPLSERSECDANEQGQSNTKEIPAHSVTNSSSSGAPKGAPLQGHSERGYSIGSEPPSLLNPSDIHDSNARTLQDSSRSCENFDIAPISVIPEENTRQHDRKSSMAPADELPKGPLTGAARRRIKDMSKSNQELRCLKRPRQKRSSFANPSDVRMIVIGPGCDIADVRAMRKRERKGSNATPVAGPPPTALNRRAARVTTDNRRWSETVTAPTPRKETARRSTWSFDGDMRLSKFVQDGEAVFHFRKSARKIMIVLQWMKVISKQDERIETKLKTFFDMAQDLDAAPKKQFMDESGLSFDPRQFRAKKAIHVTSDQKRVLTLHNDFRTHEMIQKVLTGLQHLEAFAEYPLHMQEKLAKVAWYQELPSKKLIIRQGHRAESFYFILSGSAIAKQLVRDESTGRVIMRVVGRMQRGESFGEVALVQHSERTATVESATPMQLLVVSREDFMDIFFAHSEGNEPDHITFCKNIEFLKEWPVEKCLQEPRACLFHYFRRGTVIVSDSRKTDWIYIVKTGTCTVLKKLKHVTPQRSSANPKLLDLTMKIPKDGTSCQAPRIDSRLSEAFLRYGSLNAIINRSANFLDPLTEDLKLPILQADQNTDKTSKSRYENKLTTLLSPRKSKKIPALSAPPRERMATKPGDEQRADGESSLATPKKRLASLTVKSAKMVRIRDPNHDSKPVSPRDPSGIGDEADDQEEEAWLNEIDVRSMELLVNCDGRYTNRQTGTTDPVEESPCFVQLKKLRPRDVFGLEEMLAEDDAPQEGETSVTLVSNGAELIMLSRQFFMKHANEETRKQLRHMSRPFPDEDTLQDNLQKKVNWDYYRREMVHDLLTHRTELKVLQLAT